MGLWGCRSSLYNIIKNSHIACTYYGEKMKKKEKQKKKRREENCGCCCWWWWGLGLKPQIKNNLEVLCRRGGFKYKTAFSAILAAEILSPATMHDQKQASRLINRLWHTVQETLHNSFSYPPLHLHNVHCVARRKLISSLYYFSDGGFLMKKQYNYQ